MHCSGMNSSQVWFITGCSSGFGKSLCELLLQEGESVVATARNPDQLTGLKKFAKNEKQLLTLRLDVTQTDQIKSAVEAAVAHFGRIDVCINNAGYGAMGALEELPEADIRTVFDTNVFGLIEVSRAITPLFRKQKSGRFINLSSVAGMVALPGASIYAATKFAVEGFSEALAGELASFGVKVTLIEPGGVRTEFASRSLKVAPYHPDYNEALAVSRKYYETIGGNQPGDPVACAKLMIEIGRHPNPPLRLVMGKIAIGRVEKKLADYAKERAEWREKTLLTDYPEHR